MQLNNLKNDRQIRKMETAAGGPIKKPIKRQKDGYKYIPDKESKEGWLRITDDAMSDVFATYVVKGKDKRADVRIDKKSENFDRKFKYDETEIPFIKDKEITLTNAGLYTGAKLSTNLLDSIAKYAKISGLPLKTAVGLVAKETSLGNPTVDSSLKKLAGDDFAYQLAKALNGGLHINEGKALNPKDLINFHYEELNPYLGLKNIAYKKSVGNMGDYGREGPFGDEDFLKRYRELLKLGENYSDNLAKKLLSNFNPNKNVLQAGFEFYKLNPRKYNYNQTNYPLLVEERGNMVYNSPEFKSWLSTSEYKKQGGKMNIIEQFKQGGQVRKMLTAAGGPIFIFNPAVLGSKLGKKFNNLYLYGKSYLLNKFSPGKGEVIDLSKKKVSRIKRNTSNVSSILTNEFVEKNNNVIRKKKDFVNTTDSLLGDNKIPLSKISTFYGIENGKLKAGPLKIFNDTTTVIPNRAKYVGKVKEFYPGKNNSKKYNKVIHEAINRYNIDHGYFPSTFDKIFGLTHPTKVLRNNVSSKDYFGILEQLHNKYKHLEDGKDAYVITENNDTIKNYNLNAAPKTLFADENGNAIFVANPRNHVKEINKMLLLHSMYPVMVDNGRYSAYLTQSPNAEIYSGFNDPNDMFLLGTISKKQGGMLELLKKGSGIHIKKKNKGKFTSYCGGKVTDECILKGKNSSNPAIRKRATFAANARKWKHKEGGIIKAEDGTKFNWQSALTNVGTNLFNSYLQSRVQNNKINSEAEAAKAENEVDLNQYFWDIYLQELAKALLEEELKSKAISAMNDTVINSSPLVTLKIAYDKASKSYGNLKTNLDARNKAIDAQAEAAKSSVITDAVSGVIQNGLGMLKDYYGSKNNNTSTSSSTTSNSYFDNYVNTKYKKFGTFNPDGSMNMLGGTFTIKDGYKPNQPQLFNYQPPKLNV